MPGENEDRLDRRIEGLISPHALLALDLKSLAAENRALGALALISESARRGSCALSNPVSNELASLREGKTNPP